MEKRDEKTGTELVGATNNAAPNNPLPEAKEDQPQKDDKQDKDNSEPNDGKDKDQKSYDLDKSQVTVDERDSDSKSSDSDRERNLNRNVQTTENQPATCPEHILTLISWAVFAMTFPLSLFFCLIVLQEYERAVILRFGRLRSGGPRGPGLVFILPCIDAFVRVDLRTTSLDVPSQDILTKDSVTVNVDSVVYYRVSNPVDFTLQVADPSYCIELLAMTTLRNITGSYMLVDLIASKKSLSRLIKGTLDNAGSTDPWGVRIERVEITDIVMAESLQRAMAVEQEARREAMAKVAAANGERDAVKALKEAADIMESNPIALQLRYLQTLNTICNENTKSIVFPLPVDILAKLMK